MGAGSERIRKDLLDMADIKYRDFNLALLPGIEKENSIGIRVPIIRNYAKNISLTLDAVEFLSDLPHRYLEENHLHGFIIEGIADYDTAIFKTEEFLPYIDNWQICDIFSPKIFKKHTDNLINKVYEWISSKHPYTVRYGIGMLMRYCLDDNFKPQYLDDVAGINSDCYYVNTMIAWFFATALAKQYSSAVTFIEKHRLSPDVHNKTIQKAIESRRITYEQKSYLSGFKIKSPVRSDIL